VASVTFYIFFSLLKLTKYVTLAYLLRLTNKTYKFNMMIKKYFFGLLIVLISVHFLSAQNCPTSIANQSTTDIPFFKIDQGSSDCADYPDSITIDGSIFDKLSCSGANLKYHLRHGETPISSAGTFSADFGLGVCDYVNGELQTLSKDEFSKVNNPIIYPNPTSKSEFLNIRLKDQLTASILIYDLTGKLILKENMNNSIYKQINISPLNNGVYLLQIIADDISATRKIVVTN